MGIMELITIILSGVLSALANGGWIADAIAKNTLNSNLDSVETLEVRIDNRPNYQLINGKLDKLRIATRGILIEQGLRIDVLELETDPISVDVTTLRNSNFKDLPNSFRQPLQAAARIVITEADLTTALQSETVVQQLQETINGLVAQRAGNSTRSYELSALQIDLLPENRIKLELQLSRLGTDKKQNRELALALELGFEVIAGVKVNLVEPQGTVNGRPMSERLLGGFAQGISDRLDLTNLESLGILARLLQLEITEDKIELVAFTRIEPQSAKTNLSEQVKP
ncbi:Protein of unknown function (DUF2993) [Xenococcus sp. PCC 7305]|nr:Protein of unknown function (DUF2993) [Xenococcus sp. PCC 7305]